MFVKGISPLRAVACAWCVHIDPTRRRLEHTSVSILYFGANL